MPNTGNNLFISELFGPTFQGEGRNTGMPCMFLRLAGCNLACSWCDTQYAWNWRKFDVKKETRSEPWEKVFDQLIESPVKRLVITGGEPLLQQKNLLFLTDRLHRAGWWTELETAGTIVPDHKGLVRQYTVSPKLANSGNPVRKAFNPDAIRWFKRAGAVFKFVVTTDEDFQEIDHLVNEFGLECVYVMPEGIDALILNTRTQLWAEMAIKRGYNISTRLQVQVYGAKRGV